MTAPDTPRVVDIHLAAFPGFFLSFLGSRFLHMEAVALGELVYVADDVLGFIMGSAVRRAAHSSGGCSGAACSRSHSRPRPAMLRRPTPPRRRLRALVKPCDAERPAGTGMIMRLGGGPVGAGVGHGTRARRGFPGRGRRRGAMRVDLTTDKVDNEVANVFYARLGFGVAREVVTPEGRVLNEPIIDL